MADGVHVQHCCIVHGCKYHGGAHCPVSNGSLTQAHLCELCDHTVDAFRVERIALNRMLAKLPTHLREKVQGELAESG